MLLIISDAHGYPDIRKNPDAINLYGYIT